MSAGVALRAHSVAGAPDGASLALLARALESRIDAEGAIPFRPDARPPLPNVWCAMFAEQALRWHAQPSQVSGAMIV